MSQPTRFSAALPLWPLVLLLLTAYVLPWLVNPGVSLTAGGYDLAEWVSIHPVVRFGNPPLVASLLLRLPLAIVALIAASNTGERRFALGWWLTLMFVGVIAAALLPPLEFFTIYRDDPNYQQQFAIALVTLFGGLIGISGVTFRWRRWLTIVLALLGAAVSLVGLLQAYQLMQQFRLPTQIGAGSVVMIVLFLTLGLSEALAFFQGRRVITTSNPQTA